MATKEIDLQEGLVIDAPTQVPSDREEAIKRTVKQIEEAKKKLKELREGTGPAVKSGSVTAIDTTGILLQHSNPFSPAKTFGFWAMAIGTITIVGWGLQLIGGGFSAASDPRPLPANAPVAMRLGHSVVSVGSPVVGTVLVGTASTINQGVRVQLASTQSRPYAPTNVSASNNGYVPVVPVARYTGQ